MTKARGVTQTILSALSRFLSTVKAGQAGLPASRLNMPALRYVSRKYHGVVITIVRRSPCKNSSARKPAP